MGLFGKKSPMKQVHDGAWGYMVTVNHVDVDALGRDYRVVEKDGQVEGVGAVILMRVFRLPDVAKAGVTVTGWETFDQHPELIAYEGYLGPRNQAKLDARSAPAAGAK